MSSNFYSKAQKLYEEFKNKELHYLKGEQNLNDTLMWKKDLNMPLQEYLQKIHQREKKTEETYQSIMRQMNELDQHTDLLLLKIDKCEIFRNVQTGYDLNDTNHSLISRYISPSLNAVQNFNTELTTSHIKSSYLKLSALKCASTQTESSEYCKNCISLVQSSQPNQLQNLSSTTDILSVSKDEPQIIHSSRMQNDSFSFLSKNNNFKLSASSEQTEHIPFQMYDNCRSLIKISSEPSQLQNSSSSIIDILSESKDEPHINDSTKLQNDSFSFLSRNCNNPQFNTSEKIEHVPPQTYENEECIEKHSKSKLEVNDKDETKSTVNTMLEKKQLSLKSNESLIAENAPKNSASKQLLTESKSNESEINVENSKSDVDSVNQEFDFLESSAPHSSSKVQVQISSKNNISRSADISQKADQTASLDVKVPKSSLKLKNEKDTFYSSKEQEISDNRSETSGNVSDTHSPVISLSDSDSINERGSLTASTAYQSLLGNTAITSKINKQVLESDSEDEVEKTLASTVKNSNMKAKSSSQPKKDKSASQPVDSKLAVNRPKHTSMNKPQSKLSKSTKKVLGIDTSSSSEMEVAVKTYENKKDEDSDEFDFYD